jgi:uncharacterized metal-binding protein
MEKDKLVFVFGVGWVIWFPIAFFSLAEQNNSYATLFMGGYFEGVFLFCPDCNFQYWRMLAIAWKPYIYVYQKNRLLQNFFILNTAIKIVYLFLVSYLFYALIFGMLSIFTIPLLPPVKMFLVVLSSIKMHLSEALVWFLGVIAGNLVYMKK